MVNRVLFGAGKIGNRAASNRALLEADKVSFCDNNVCGGGKIINGIPIITFEELKENYDETTEIIITTACYNEIYCQCKKYGMNIKGIYDEKTDEVKDYYQYCKDNYKDYYNDRYVEYQNLMEEKKSENVERFLKGESLSNCLTGIAIMISNVCNYACLHVKCPAHEEKEKQIMSFRDIKYIVDELSHIGFSGKIMFHIYNEPMNDPRLFSIIDYVRMKLKDVKIIVYTNGFYLTDVIVKELEEATVNVLITTAYGKKEFNRLMEFKPNIAYQIHYGVLDNRMDFYDEIETKLEGIPCRGLLDNVCIYVNGDIGLCCLDYRHESELGNVFKEGFMCINKGKIRKFQTELLKGNRIERLCQRCGWKI